MDAGETAASRKSSAAAVRSVLASALVLLAVFVVFMSTGRTFGSFDNVPLRYLPLSILREGNFDLNEFAFVHAHDALLYPVQYQNGRFLPFVPVGAGLLAVPFYVIPALAGMSAESSWLPYVEKVAAAGISTLSALCILLGLTHLVPARTARLTAVLYALGTATFGVSSQSLWPVGSTQLLLSLGLYILIRGRDDPRWSPYAALALATAVLCRPSAALIGLTVALYVFCHQRKRFLPFGLFALPAVAFQLAYNFTYFGEFFLSPGYVSSGGHVLARLENFSTPLWKGLVGLLVSPAVGFFIYSPVFVFALVGAYRRWRAHDWLGRYLAGAALLVILLDSKLNMWWGGIVLGPRYVVEVAPIFAYFLAFGVPGSREPLKKVAFGVLAAWSVYANGLVAFAFDGTWDRHAQLWSWSNSPIVYYSDRPLNALRSLGPAFVRWSQGLPDSRTGSGLAANLQVRGLPPRIRTNSVFDVTVRVKNSGQTAWLRRTSDGTGTVRIGWRWIRSDGHADATGEGRGPWLPTDLLPGRQASLVATILAPAEPGRYELELGMVSEGVRWFGQDGGPPTRTPAEVGGSSLCDFEAAMAAMAGPAEPPLQMQWATDAAVTHQALSARLNLSNPGPPRVLYPVIVLRWPSGQHSFFDLEQQSFRSLCPGWIERAPPMFFDHGYRTVQLPILSLLPSRMPRGPYVLYFVFIRPEQSAVRVVAKTALAFELTP